ncbi:hypothetical protein [Marinomonas sp. 2405UD68-3]|uniref:hypothetical protein n=1 Tax=Marinomonas sp. 2405UD68-3 TaxID=3391835 RepID=UPI0039C96620
MNIGSQLPVISNSPSSRSSVSQKTQMSVTENRGLVASPSNQSHFESVFSTSGRASFSRIDNIDRLTQDALNMYSQNQSLGVDNPRDYLVGVDVYV